MRSGWRHRRIPVGGSGVDQLITNCVAHEISDAMNFKFPHEVCSVGFCGFDADTYGSRHFFGAIAFTK